MGLIYPLSYPPAGREFVGKLKQFMGKWGFVGKAQGLGFAEKVRFDEIVKTVMKNSA